MTRIPDNWFRMGPQNLYISHINYANPAQKDRDLDECLPHIVDGTDFNLKGQHQWLAENITDLWTSYLLDDNETQRFRFACMDDAVKFKLTHSR